MANPATDEEAAIIQPPDELRCKRSDGKNWRCHHWRIHDQGLCEKHFLDYMTTTKKRKGKSKKGECGSVSVRCSKNAKPRKGLRVGSAVRKAMFCESEEEEVIPQKKNRSGIANAERNNNTRGSSAAKSLNEGFLSNREKNLKRRREEFEEEVVQKKKRKVDIDLSSRGPNSAKKLVIKNKKGLKVAYSEEKDAGKENKDVYEEMLAGRKARTREKLKRIFQSEAEQDEERKRKPRSKIGLADGRRNPMTTASNDGKKFKVEESKEDKEDFKGSLVDRKGRSKEKIRKMIELEGEQVYELERKSRSNRGMAVGKSNTKVLTTSNVRLISSLSSSKCADF